VAVAVWFFTQLVAILILSIVLSIADETHTPVALRPPWVTAVSVTALWIPALLALRWVSDHDGTGHFRDDYGLHFRLIDVIGIPIGILSQLVLLPLLYWPLSLLFHDTFNKDQVEKPARDLVERLEGGWLILIVFIVVVGAPLVEELLYRGLIFRSLEARFAAPLAIFLSAAWFGIAHFEWIQLPGLFAFGIVLAICAYLTRRLGMGVLAHAGFNATSVVMMLSKR
jgi:membrane protease YdiL (CAAX protease family)